MVIKKLQISQFCLKILLDKRLRMLLLKQNQKKKIDKFISRIEKC